MASLWTMFGTPVIWIFHVFSIYTTHRGKILLPLFWALLFIIRLLPLESFTQANEVEPFRWSTDTVFCSRMLVVVVSIFKLYWLVVKNLAIYISCALITGGLFRFVRDFLQGRFSTERMRAAEKRNSQMAFFITLYTGALLDLLAVATYYFCRLVGLLFGWTKWEAALHVIAIVILGAVRTIWLQKLLIGEIRHQRLERESSPLSTILELFYNGATTWLNLVLFWLLFQDRLLPGEILLSTMTGLSRNTIFVRRLVLCLAFGRLYAFFLRQWLLGEEVHRRETEREKNMQFNHLLISTTLVGGVIYCPLVAILTVGKILSDMSTSAHR